RRKLLKVVKESATYGREQCPQNPEPREGRTRSIPVPGTRTDGSRFGMAWILRTRSSRTKGNRNCRLDASTRSIRTKFPLARSSGNRIPYVRLNAFWVGDSDVSNLVDSDLHGDGECEILRDGARNYSGWKLRVLSILHAAERGSLGQLNA